MPTWYEYCYITELFNLNWLCIPIHFSKPVEMSFCKIFDDIWWIYSRGFQLITVSFQNFSSHALQCLNNVDIKFIWTTYSTDPLDIGILNKKFTIIETVHSKNFHDLSEFIAFYRKPTIFTYYIEINEIIYLFESLMCENGM